ncbi:chitin synthase-domain-containing protein [Zychaea mexicana]|uniref:chitin synthase-domain-containing protein n=1 Tax=Zychaea mexicana TaxID=64656 RepID=UPI0022FECFBA|nr:chitin synthase-domain-containing protein [Zychaea mexicana]KAI9488172.1 chitin synthase-domain-containing protein [Zychaea mexicana]
MPTNLATATNDDGFDDDYSIIKEKAHQKLRRRLLPSQKPDCWVLTSWILTWWIPTPFMRLIGIKDKQIQQAWREKVSLVIIIMILCVSVGFLTFGFNATVCGRQPTRIRPTGINEDQIIISGRVFDLKSFKHATPYPGIPASGDLLEMGYGGRDLSFMFQTVNYNCKGIFRPIVADDPRGNVINYFPCVPIDRNDPLKVNATDNLKRDGCHVSPKSRKALRKLDVVGDVYYNWTDIQQPGTSLVAFNGNVLDLSRLRYLTPNVPMPYQIAQFVGPGSAFIGRDATYWLSTTADRLMIGKCLTDVLKVGVLDTRSTGCIISDIVLWVSLAVILGVVLVRFVLALIFGWCISWKLGSIREETAEERRIRQDAVLQWEMNNVEQMHYPRRRSISSIEESLHSTTTPSAATGRAMRRFFPTTSRFTQPNSPSYGSRHSPYGSRGGLFGASNSADTIHQNSNNNNNNAYVLDSQFFRELHSLGRLQRDAAADAYAQKEHRFNFDLLYTFMVVTCYSEGEEGLRTTLDSLANTEYPASHKVLLVICDGIITGSGNTKSTPDIALDMMKDDLLPRDQVKPVSYVAIADGMRRHNMAKVYAGYYKYNDDPSKAPEPKPLDQQQRVPMIIIAKCGTPAERKSKKPGNRGKRDSQVILMNTMQKIFYHDRMCELEFQFCKAIAKLVDRHPARFQCCLMVDADTKVYPDSLARMVATMSRDSRIMGLCGETKIANKSDSWVTAIQVFEYYISHHMSKAFESIFGGVTCLPGCFCMYRIIAPKGEQYVPIFCSTDIVESYCENVVDTLHKKNLLLLGEDRYLTTLMLRTFPKRKMVFVPQAVCKTVVPDTFPVLLSQRRRWINSTVHNLLELVLIRDLCGTFCFSMQFVVFMELVGTVVLPAAISFTLYLVVISFFVRPVPIIPLLLLAAILGLPAVLIALTTRKMVYVGWMMVYLCSLPIWNFLLPAYAYWNFDDFSWGETRQVQGITGQHEDHSRRQGKFDGKDIVMRKFEEWARQDRHATSEEASQHVRNYPAIYYGH